MVKTLVKQLVWPSCCEIVVANFIPREIDVGNSIKTMLDRTPALTEAEIRIFYPYIAIEFF